MSAGPWVVSGYGMERVLRDGDALVVRPCAGERIWTAWCRGNPIAGGDEPTLAAAMEAADLWATEHGYPAVRVEVDP